MEELGDNLWDAVKEERQLLKRQIKLLENSLAAVREEMTGKAALQEAVEEGEEKVVASAPEMVEEETLEEKPEGEEEEWAIGGSATQATAGATIFSCFKGPTSCN